MTVMLIKKKEYAEGTGTCEFAYPNPGDYSSLLPASADLPSVGTKTVFVWRRLWADLQSAGCSRAELILNIWFQCPVKQSFFSSSSSNLKLFFFS